MDPYAARLAPEIQSFDAFWAKISDDELESVVWETSEPASLPGLREIIPDDIGPFYIETEYHLPDDQDPVRCGHCPRHQRHRRGTVIRTSEARYLVGSVCGPVAFNAAYGVACNARAAAKKRCEALRWLKKVREWLPETLQILDDALKSSDMRESYRIHSLLQNEAPVLYAELVSVAKKGGHLITKVKVRDHYAEEQRREAIFREHGFFNGEPDQLAPLTTKQRKKAMAARKAVERSASTFLFKLQDMWLATLTGADFLLNGSAANELRAAISQMRSLHLVANTPRTLPTKQLNQIAREATKQFEIAKNALVKGSAVGQFFSSVNLAMVEQWANEVFDEKFVVRSATRGLVVEFSGRTAMVQLRPDWQQPSRFLEIIPPL